MGQRLKEIIAPLAIKRIAGTRVGASFASELDHDNVIRELFASDRVSVEWGLLASESVCVEYTIVTDEALFVLSLYSNIRHEPITAAVVRGGGFACRFNLSSLADRLAVRIVVDAAERSAFALGSHPFQDKNFEMQIGEFQGRAIRELVNLDQIRKIVTPQPFVSKNGVKAVDLSDDLIVSALLTGRIIDQSDMHFALQSCRECVLQLPEEAITMGVYYKPVGYLRFGDDESYWFLFGNAKATAQTGDEGGVIPLAWK